MSLVRFWFLVLGPEWFYLFFLNYQAILQAGLLSKLRLWDRHTRPHHYRLVRGLFGIFVVAHGWIGDVVQCEVARLFKTLGCFMAFPLVFSNSGSILQPLHHSRQICFGVLGIEVNILIKFLNVLCHFLCSQLLDYWNTLIVIFWRARDIWNIGWHNVRH